ncbi:MULTISPECIES: competence type IV pilus minor pilin ComGG [Bacillus]|uniref:competence type IV pilus minor pilin ComGG n=1 Tax=Bacillus TaxID=1386 RepID=UPI000BB98617|nr:MULTISPECIES: competence type IV pilus minor pilin ComGG [Bacillus]
MRVIKNEKGYILVITMAFSLFLSALLLHHIELYTIEKQFTSEVNEVYVLENMVTVCLDEVISDLMEKNIQPSNMQRAFPSGNVNITVTGNEPNLTVKLYALTNLGRKYEVVIEVNIVTKEIVSWREI